MGRLYENILETVGNTPVVKIGKLAPKGVNLYVKIEAFNPLGACAAEKSARRSRYRMDCGWIGGSGQYDPIRQLRLGTA